MYKHVYMHVYTYIYVCVFIYIYIYMYTYMCMCQFVVTNTLKEINQTTNLKLMLLVERVCY